MNSELSSFRRFAWAPETRPWFILSLALVLIASWRSNTFHHFDEQFQILEFTAYKLGKAPVSGLRWEFAAAMRAWFQPALYFLGAKAWTALGVENPFTWAMSFRLLSGLLSWLGMWLVCWRANDWLNTEMSRWSVRLLALLWFVPYLAVRTSGETFTTIFLLFALALLLSPLAISPVLGLASGICAGLCIAVRFPSAIFVLGMFLWFAIARRAPILALLAFILGTLLPLVGSLWIDKWGYGYWTVPLWNYFHQNLIVGKSHDFGTSPFFAYLYLPSLHLLFPLTLAATVLALVAWARWPKHLLTWTCVPYVMVHSFIAHKESRFLFPIAALLPVLLPMAVQKSGRAQAFLKTPVYKALVVLNLIALTYFTVTPTRKELVLQKRIYSTNPQEVILGRLGTYHPFQSTGMESYFYRPSRTVVTELANADEITPFHQHWCDSVNFATASSNPLRILTRGAGQAPTHPLFESCQIDFESFPEFYLRQNPLRLEQQAPAWRSYVCGKDTCAR